MRKGTLALCGLKSFKCAYPVTEKGQGCGPCLKLPLTPFSVGANSEGSGETARMRVVCLCDKYPFLMCRLI